MTEEGQIKNEICEFLELFPQRCLFTLTQGIKAYKKTRRSKFNPVGWPDITGSWDGRPLMIEVKTETGSTSEEQLAMMVKANSMGWIAFVAHNPKEVAFMLGVPIR